MFVCLDLCVGVGRKPKSEGSEGRVCQQLLQVKRAGRQVNLSPCAYNGTICFSRLCASLGVCVSVCVSVGLGLYVCHRLCLSV